MTDKMQKTPKGHEIPIPTRPEVEDALNAVATPVKKPIKKPLPVRRPNK